MSGYLLSCECGQQTKVSAAQAGESVRCACGAQLDVPTLRGLRGLPQAIEPRTHGNAWSNRHRVASVLILASLGGLVATVYLAAALPAAPVLLSPEEIDSRLASSTPAQVLDVYQGLRQGLPPAPGENMAIQDERRTIFWEGSAILAASVLGLAVSVRILLKASKMNC